MERSKYGEKFVLSPDERVYPATVYVVDPVEGEYQAVGYIAENVFPENAIHFSTPTGNGFLMGIMGEHPVTLGTGGEDEETFSLQRRDDFHVGAVLAEDTPFGLRDN